MSHASSSSLAPSVPALRASSFDFGGCPPGVHTPGIKECRPCGPKNAVPTGLAVLGPKGRDISAGVRQPPEPTQQKIFLGPAGRHIPAAAEPHPVGRKTTWILHPPHQCLPVCRPFGPQDSIQEGGVHRGFTPSAPKNAGPAGLKPHDLPGDEGSQW